MRQSSIMKNWGHGSCWAFEEKKEKDFQITFGIAFVAKHKPNFNQMSNLNIHGICKLGSAHLHHEDKFHQLCTNTESITSASAFHPAKVISWMI